MYKLIQFKKCGAGMKNLLITVLFVILFSNAWAEDAIKIPVIYGQMKTTVNKYIAAEDLRGALLAADKLNESGGILGKKVEIIDARASNIIEGVVLAKKLVQNKNIYVIIGANTSNLSLAVTPFFQKAGIPTISPISTNPKVTAAGDYIFRACFIDPFQGEIMSEFALKNLKAKTVAIITKIDSVFSRSLTEVFSKSFSTNGKIIYKGKYLSTDSDFTETLNKIKELKPDVVFVPGHGKDVGLLLKQAYSMGIKTTFLGGDGWGKGALGIAGAEAAEGNFFVNHWHVNVDTDLSRNFVEAYYKKFGKSEIAASAALSYDAVMLMAHSISKAGSLNKSEIRNNIANINGYKGVTGTYSFDKQGDPQGKSAVILKYHNGKIIFVESVTP